MPNCRNCGKSIPEYTVFCSEECGIEHTHKKKKRTAKEKAPKKAESLCIDTRVCINCGKAVVRKKRMSRKAFYKKKYCSHYCIAIHLNLQQYREPYRISNKDRIIKKLDKELKGATK